MRKVCPQCQGSFDTQFLCPTCGVQLLDVPDRSAVITAAAGDEGLRADRVGRQLFAGVVLALGLYIAAWQASTGLALMGVLPEPGNVFVLLGLAFVTALGGGLVAGVGNPRGLAAGTVVGVLGTVLLAGSQFGVAGQSPSAIPLWVWLPPVAAGAAGGLFARCTWPSVHDLPDPTSRPKEKKVRVKRVSPPVPIAWLRIISGTALAIGCTVWAGWIRNSLISLGAGAFVMESRIQSQFIAWVITTLAMVIGGAFAAAGSHGGIRHGFLVGLLSCIGIFVIHQNVVREVLPAEEFFASLFRLPEENGPSAMQTILFLLTNTLLIGVAAGWFGSKLLPKIGERESNLDRGSI